MRVAATTCRLSQKKTFIPRGALPQDERICWALKRGVERPKGAKRRRALEMGALPVFCRVIAAYGLPAVEMLWRAGSTHLFLADASALAVQGGTTFVMRA